jgi:hypothetical protein
VNHRPAFTLALLLSLLPLAARAQILSVHDLASDPKRYDGQQVTVRAFANFGYPHSYMLLQSRQDYADKPGDDEEIARSCMEVLNPQRLYRTQRERQTRIHRHTITVRGTFVADKFGGGEGFSLGGCSVNKRAIVAEKLLRVDP